MLTREVLIMLLWSFIIVLRSLIFSIKISYADIYCIKKNNVYSLPVRPFFRYVVSAKIKTRSGRDMARRVTCWCRRGNVRRCWTVVWVPRKGPGYRWLSRVSRISASAPTTAARRGWWCFKPSNQVIWYSLWGNLNTTNRTIILTTYCYCWQN